MASHGPSDLQNAVIKTQTAALGFRVKSGWAAQNLGRSVPAKARPWRAEQKLAALAALFALR
jgi:hypothetical protein